MKSKLFACLLGLAALLTLGASLAVADATIYQVRQGYYPVGTVVECDSVVVTAVGLFVYFVEEPIPDPTIGRQYGSIQVFTNANHDGIHKGMIVNVRSVYSEYQGMSELNLTTGTDHFQTVVGTATVPPPADVLISDVNQTGALAEAYEGVFIRLLPSPGLYTFAPTNPSYDEWNIRYNNVVTDDSLLVGHWASPKPGDDFLYTDPPVPSNLTFIQGIIVWKYNARMLDPRDCVTDIGVPSCPPALLGAYSTGSTTVNVEFSLDVSQATAEAVGNYTLSNVSTLTATRDAVYHRFVHLTTGAQTNAAADQITVSNVAADLGGAVMAPNQKYSFLDGITSLYDIQYVPDPVTSGDSQLLGMTLTTRARVSAVQGGYYFLQSGDGGPWKALYSRVTATGGLPVVGDSLMVSGKVTEYYNETELAYTTGVDNFVKYGRAPHAIVVNTLSADTLALSNPNRSAEKWEGQLVRILNATVKDSIPGVPGPSVYEYPLMQQVNPVALDTAGVACNSIATTAPGSYEPCVGDRISVTGVLRYVYGGYRIAPRSGLGGDIVIDYDNPACVATSVPNQAGHLTIDLDQNQPNPFGGSTAIRLNIPTARPVSLEVLDVAGRLVKVLASGNLTVGEHTYTWDGTNRLGHPVSSGTYFYRLKSNGTEVSRKMVFVQ